MKDDSGWVKGRSQRKGQNGENDAVGRGEWGVGESSGWDILMWRNRGGAERKGARTSHHKSIWHMATRHRLGTVPRSDSIVPALGKLERTRNSPVARRQVTYGMVFLYGTVNVESHTTEANDPTAQGMPL